MQIIYLCLKIAGFVLNVLGAVALLCAGLLMGSWTHIILALLWGVIIELGYFGNEYFRAFWRRSKN